MFFVVFFLICCTSILVFSLFSYFCSFAPLVPFVFFFFFSSRRRHTRSLCDWSSDVCSSDLAHSYGLPLKRLPRPPRAVSLRWSGPRRKPFRARCRSIECESSTPGCPTHPRLRRDRSRRSSQRGGASRPECSCSLETCSTSEPAA